MAGNPPFFVFTTPGGGLAFPMQDGQPVCITEADFKGCCCKPIIGYRLSFEGVRIEYGDAYPFVGVSDGFLDYMLAGGETEVEFAGTIGDFHVDRLVYSIASKTITYLVFEKAGYTGFSTELSNPWFTVTIPKVETVISVPQLVGVLYYDEDGFLDLVGEGTGTNTFRTSAGTISVSPIRG